MAPQYKLFAVDLDGTLLPYGDMQARHKDVAALRICIDKGLTVAIATGRPHASAKQVLAQIGLPDLPIISFNGAMVWLPEEDQPALHETVPADVLPELLQMAVERRWHLHYFIVNRLLVPRVSHWAWDYYRRTGIRPEPVGDLRRFADQPPTKIIIMHNPDEVPALTDELAERFRGRAYVTRSQPEMVEIMNPNVNKGRALLWLAERLGLERDATAAIGDGVNDAPLIEAAGLGLAVPDAADELKAVADVVLERTDAPVAEAVQRFLCPAQSSD